MKVNKQKYPGHNPAASVIMLAIMVAIILVVVSGMANLASEGQGLLSFMKLNGESEFYEETHEVMVNILIVLVALHLAGIAIDTIFHRENGTLASIFTGYKKVKGDNVKLNGLQKAFSLVWIAGAITLFSLAITTQNLKLSDAETEKNSKEVQESGEEEAEDD